MKTFITIIFFLSLHYLSNAQVDMLLTTDKKIYAKIKELKAKNVDTIISYYIGCSNCDFILRVPNDTSCHTYEQKYLIWHQDHQYYLERFDDCKEYNPLVINSAPYELLIRNYSKILKERIRTPEFIKIVNGKRELLHSSDNDYPYYIIKIYVGNKIIKKDIDEYDLNTKYLDGKHPNRNYLPNQRSALNKLKTLIEKEVLPHYPDK